MRKYMKKARGGGAIVVDLITHHHHHHNSSSGVRTRSRSAAQNCGALQHKEKDHRTSGIKPKPSIRSSNCLSVSRKQSAATTSGRSRIVAKNNGYGDDAAACGIIISNYLELRSRKLEKLRLDIRAEIKRDAAAAAEMDLSAAEGIRSREFEFHRSSTKTSLGGDAFSEGFLSAEEGTQSRSTCRKSGEENNNRSRSCSDINYTHPSSSSDGTADVPPAGSNSLLQMNCAVDPIQQGIPSRNGNSIIGDAANLAMATWTHRTSSCDGSIISAAAAAALSRNNSVTRLDLLNTTNSTWNSQDPQTPPNTVQMQEALSRSPHHHEIPAAVRISPTKYLVHSEAPKAQVSSGDNALADELPALSFGGDSPANIPSAVSTPGSQLPAQTCGANSNSDSNPKQLISSRNIAAAQSRLQMEIEDFLSDAEQREHKRFVEKYNFDPVNGVPLPGRYEWFGGCN